MNKDATVEVVRFVRSMAGSEGTRGFEKMMAPTPHADLWGRLSIVQAFSYAIFALEKAEELGWYPATFEKSDWWLSGPGIIPPSDSVKASTTAPCSLGCKCDIYYAALVKIQRSPAYAHVTAQQALEGFDIDHAGAAVELLRQEYNCASVEALALCLHDDLTIARRASVLPAVIPCYACEMGTVTPSRHSRNGRPVQVLCSACLDGEVLHDPRGVRRGSLPVVGTDAIAAGSHVREQGNATTAESRAHGSTAAEARLASLNVALWGESGYTYPPGVVDRVLGWLKADSAAASTTAPHGVWCAEVNRTPDNLALQGCSGQGRPSCTATECFYGVETCPICKGAKPVGGKCGHAHKASAASTTAESERPSNDALMTRAIQIALRLNPNHKGRDVQFVYEQLQHVRTYASVSASETPIPAEPVRVCSLCQSGHIHDECDTVGVVTPVPAEQTEAKADDYWIFQSATACHDEVFPAHDFQTRFPGSLKEHPHCTRCHVPEGSSESNWNGGRCTHRTFLTVPAHIVKAAALAPPPSPAPEEK